MSLSRPSPISGTFMHGNKGRPSWRIRRSIIFSTLTYCAAIGVWAVAQGAEMAGVVLGPAFGLAGGIIAAYVFGAAAEDVFISRNRRNGAP